MAMAEFSDASLALRAGLSVEGITMYLFWIGTVAMGAGTAFFWLMAGTVPRAYRSVMIVAGIITAVACYHYSRMSGIYIEQLATLFNADGTRIAGKEITQFPTAYRYIDWLITVPLLVLEIPLLLRLGNKAKALFRGLVGAALVMLVFAWIAEVSPVGSNSWWINYVISCLAWFYIVFMLYTKVNEQMVGQPISIVKSLKIIRLYILIGWTIYPVGFLMALAGPSGESIREICYNIADVINKVGFGLACYAGIKVLPMVAGEDGPFQANTRGNA
jgi:bacteriorhodopsin